MKANKRTRDPRRRSNNRLSYIGRDDAHRSTTTFPLTKKDRAGSQVRNLVKISRSGATC